MGEINLTGDEKKIEFESNLVSKFNSLDDLSLSVTG
jgi:hypothetical protein